VSRLGEITAPTLLVAGREDFVFPPDCQRELLAGIRGSELVLVDEAGHNPQDEDPAAVMAALRPFLTGARDPRQGFPRLRAGHPFGEE
jgi:proline iminopeptidase